MLTNIGIFETITTIQNQQIFLQKTNQIKEENIEHFLKYIQEGKVAFRNITTNTITGYNISYQNMLRFIGVKIKTFLSERINECLSIIKFRQLPASILFIEFSKMRQRTFKCKRIK